RGAAAAPSADRRADRPTQRPAIAAESATIERANPDLPVRVRRAIQDVHAGAVPGPAGPPGVFRRKGHVARGVCRLGRPGGRRFTARSHPWLLAFGCATHSVVARRRDRRILRGAAWHAGTQSPTRRALGTAP